MRTQNVQTFCVFTFTDWFGDLSSTVGLFDRQAMPEGCYQALKFLMPSFVPKIKISAGRAANSPLVTTPVI